MNLESAIRQDIIFKLQKENAALKKQKLQLLNDMSRLWSKLNSKGNTMDKIILMRQLKAFVSDKSKAQAAKEIGISLVYLRDILLERRAVTCPPILKKFGYKKAIVYKKVS